MNLNLNSITAKLYRWFYATNAMPLSLCPYFRKLLFMWLLILPYSIFCIPAIIIEIRDKDPIDSTVSRVGGSIIIYMTLLIILCMLFSIYAFFYTVENDLNSFAMLGYFGWILLTGIALIEATKFIVNKFIINNNKTIENEKESSILIEWVKSAYFKYCPQITWKNDKD